MSGNQQPEHGRRTRDERGTATAFVVGMAITLLMCAGLVLDGGTALNARMKLADEVEQAARAGAQEIDVEGLRGSGDPSLDAAAAEARARAFLTSRGYTVTDVRVTADTVTVAARDRVDTQLLSLINYNTFSISASATAEAVTQ